MIEFYGVQKAKQDPLFVEDEDLMAEKLQAIAKSNWHGSEEELDARTHKRVENAAEIVAALLLLSKMSNVQTGELDTQFLIYIDNLMLKGSAHANAGTKVLMGLRTESVKNAIVQASKYYSNTYYNRVIIPLVQSHAEKAIIQGANAHTLYHEIKQKIDQHYSKVNYWSVVANVNASRAYHYGVVKGAQIAGYTKVRYSAVMDSRTSAICTELNGKTWEIATMVDIYEKQAAAQTQEELISIAPWVSAKSLKDMSDDQMAAAGVITPPRHGRCRSTLEVF